MKFLDKSIRRLSEKFFSGKIYVKLHPIDANVGDCVHNKEKKTYDCECRSNYQITIERDLYITVQNILNGENFKDRDLTSTDYFATALFFLKFLPQTAPLYIAFLFSEYNLHWARNDLRTTYSNFSLVEETDQFRNSREKLFKKIFETAVYEQLDINILAALFQDYN